MNDSRPQRASGAEALRPRQRRKWVTAAAAFGSVCLMSCLIAVHKGTSTANRHNLVLFVPDGLRGLAVTRQSAPAMADVRDDGVFFRNSHSLFPTFTTPNASAMATGHYLADTGDFGNTLFTGFPVPSAGGSVTPFLENHLVLDDIDEQFGGNYLGETALLRAAREAGYQTATIGKLGPAFIFDHTHRSGAETIVVDDATGSLYGIPLSREILEALTNAGLPTVAPPRGQNGDPGTALSPGTTTPNVFQQDYFVDVVAKVILPRFKTRKAPFVLVFWSRDPDGTQHNQGDSLNVLDPGINGPTSMAAIQNADNDLARLRRALDSLNLSESTNLIVASDHGFSTISKQSETSYAARTNYSDVLPGFLPPGFLAIDLAISLALPLFDPDDLYKPIRRGAHPVLGNGVIGSDSKLPAVIVAANGGSDLIYVPSHDRAIVARIIDALVRQDYVGGLFADESIGRFAGSLALGEIGLKGSALTPTPAIIVSFRSEALACAEPTTCAIEVADTPLQQGQGMHGSFSRADTLNFAAAIGPDFRRKFVDAAPISNADVGRTLTALLGLAIQPHGRLRGRILSEAMMDGANVQSSSDTKSSDQAPNGFRTVLRSQRVGRVVYFDAAGSVNRTVGLTESPSRRQ